MKLSFKLNILQKVFLFSIGLVTLVMAGVLFLNNNFFEEYYANQRVEQLKEVRELIAKKGSITTEEAEEYSQKYNMTINIKKSITNQSRSNNQNGLNNRRILKKDLDKNGEGNRVAKHMGMESLEYYKLLPTGELVILRISMDSIKSTVGIVNSFFIYAVILVLTLSMFFVFLFSKKMTKPILTLNEVIKGMVKMDFSYRVNFKSGDELEELGKNINFLAHELEENIEKLKLSNKKLVEEIEKKKKIDDLRKEFIASVSHEIKTPITVINTHAEMLLYDLVEKEVEKKEYLKTIMGEGENISKLLSELIEIIKLEEKVNDLNIEKFEMDKMLKDELNRYKIDLEGKNVSIKLELEKDLMVVGDESKIRQVVTNIMSNAISYVDYGGELRINLFSLPVSSSTKGIKVEITNSGSFIPEEKLENIWKAFYTIEESRNRKYGGTGLGLAIVSEILKRHNSKFGVENIKNGVKFWFTLDKIEKL